jgi:hypothetical protein
VAIVLAFALAGHVEHAASSAVHVVIEAAEVGALIVIAAAVMVVLALLGRRARYGARILRPGIPPHGQVIEHPGTGQLASEDVPAITASSSRPAWPFAEPGEVYGTLDIQPGSDHPIARTDRITARRLPRS